MPGMLLLALRIKHVVLYLPGKQRPCCMYCTAHIGQVRSATDVAVQLGLLVTYVMELDMSSPNPSKAYTAQSVCAPAGKTYNNCSADQKMWVEEQRSESSTESRCTSDNTAD